MSYLKSTTYSPRDLALYIQRGKQFKQDWRTRRNYWKEQRASGTAFNAPATSNIDRAFYEDFGDLLHPNFNGPPKLANAQAFKVALEAANGRRARPGVLSWGQVKALGLESVPVLMEGESLGNYAILFMALPEWRGKALEFVTAVVLFPLTDGTVLGHAERLSRGHLFLPGDRIQKIGSDDVRLFFPQAYALFLTMPANLTTSPVTDRGFGGIGDRLAFSRVGACNFCWPRILSQSLDRRYFAVSS